jgi:hypothetical protein
MDGYRIDGPQGLFFLLVNGDGFYVGAVAQKVEIYGSPVIVTFDPPIAPTIDAGELYRSIVAGLPS